jgi:hypothetical protein
MGNCAFCAFSQVEKGHSKRVGHIAQDDFGGVGAEA